jgi:hypothetical protein
VSEPFSRAWVHRNLDLRRAIAHPKPEARDRIAGELNKAFAQYSPRVDTSCWPHFLRLRLPRDVHKRIHHGRRQWLWCGFVLSAAEMIYAELHRAKVPGVGYSAKGPVVKLLKAAIPLITCETPTGGAIAKELERQRGAVVRQGCGGVAH